MNQVHLLGRITKDFELKGEATKYCGFSLAVNRKFKKDGEDTADFIICKCFGKTAEFASKYFSKGQQVAISGRIQTGSYEGKDGKKVYTTEVVVEDMFFADTKKDKTETQTQVKTIEQLQHEGEDELPF